MKNYYSKKKGEVIRKNRKGAERKLIRSDFLNKHWWRKKNGYLRSIRGGSYNQCHTLHTYKNNNNKKFQNYHVHFWECRNYFCRIQFGKINWKERTFCNEKIKESLLYWWDHVMPKNSEKSKIHLSLLKNFKSFSCVWVDGIKNIF